MIVLSLVLVVAAAVLLVLGVFADGLTLIYLSIAACLLAMAMLGVGVLLRRRESAASSSGGGSAVGAGAAAPAPATSSQPAAQEVRPTSAASDPAQAGASGQESKLASVKGLGPAQREALLDHFEDDDGLRDATIEELTAVPGVGPGLARAIKEALG